MARLVLGSQVWQRLYRWFWIGRFSTLTGIISGRCSQMGILTISRTKYIVPGATSFYRPVIVKRCWKTAANSLNFTRQRSNLYQANDEFETQTC